MSMYEGIQRTEPTPEEVSAALRALDLEGLPPALWLSAAVNGVLVNALSELIAQRDPPADILRKVLYTGMGLMAATRDHDWPLVR